MRQSTSVLVLALALAATARAQLPTFVAPGDIAAAARIAELRIADPAGVTSNAYATIGGFDRILWDPSAPDSFIVGDGSTSANGGFLSRISFFAPGQVTTNPIVLTGSGLPAPAQLSWDQTGDNVIVVSAVTDQIYQVNVDTGVVMPLTSGAQAWGNAVTCGALDPLSGDIYVGTNGGEIWRWASSTGGIALIQGGLAPTRKLLFDSNAAPHRLYVASTSSFSRIDLANPTAPAQAYYTAITPGAITNLTSVSFDINGDFVIATSADQLYTLPNVTTIPPNGIVPTFLSQLAYTTTAAVVDDISIVGATSQPFRLVMQALPLAGAFFRLDNVPQPLGRGWLLLSTTTPLPFDTGPFFGLVPDGLTLAIITAPTTPGGLFAFESTPPMPVTAPPLTLAPYIGETWDGVAIAFSPAGQFLGRTNLVRVTWQ